MLRSRSKRVLALVGRQMGKTSAAAIKALHRACFTERAEVLIIATGQRQAELLIDRTKDYFDRLTPVQAIKTLRTELWLANGSRIIALPNDPTTVRGYTPALVVLDESSRLDEGMLAAVVPMVTESDGELLLCSTPAGRRGFFFAAWSDETQDWERISARRADYAHRVRPGYLEEQMKILGPALYKQEHENEFIEDGDQLISHDAIRAMSRPRPGLAVMYALEGL
jgi:hypothetical protein